jgi:predicted Zn finger-like uncharacterized protein
MPIITRCPECSAAYKVPDEAIGRQARCRCGHLFIIAQLLEILATFTPPQHLIVPSIAPATS